MRRTLFLALAPIALACQILVGVRERTLEPREAGLDASLADAGCGDLRVDPNNCGYCGRACSPCVEGIYWRRRAWTG